MPNASMPDRTSWTVLELVRWTTAYFNAQGLENPRMEAEILLAHALGARRIDLYLNHDQPLDAGERNRFKDFIKRRLIGEPTAYITGVREFWSMEMAVGPSVLIPRPETECLVEAVLPFLKQDIGRPKRVLDLGTGSGAIVIALAHEYREGRFVAMDRSVEALWLARQNAHRHHVADRIDWYCGDWDAPLTPDRGTFDLIVSNPPYIRSGDIDGLQPEVRDHEPRLALDGSPDGIACIETIIQSAHRYLHASGWLALEMGCDQADAVTRVANRVGQYDNLRIVKDYSGLDRLAVMAKKRVRSRVES